MKTYHLEYYYDFSPEKVETCYFTTDKNVKGGIIKSEEIYVIYITLKSDLGNCITRYSSDFSNRHRSGSPFQIHYKVLSEREVTFTENKLLSDDFISYIRLIEFGLNLLYNKLTNSDIQKYQDEIEKHNLEEATNYFKCKIERLFWQHIELKKPLEYLYTIFDSIYHLLGNDIIKKFDMADYYLDNMSNKEVEKSKVRIYSIMTKVMKDISQVISEMTDIFRFHYTYSPYINLKYYFSRVFDLLRTEIDLCPEEDTKKKLELDNELIRQRNILSELAEYNDIDRLFNILYEVDKLYNFNELKKLDKCCIALLLANFCPLFKKQAIKPFKKFKKLICEYYGSSDVSFKENDCIERVEEVYNQQKGFWRYDTKKNPRKQHYLKK